jgi:hypothetical protein
VSFPPSMLGLSPPDRNGAVRVLFRFLPGSDRALALMAIGELALTLGSRRGRAVAPV